MEKPKKLKVESSEIVPVCPYCDEDLDKLIEVWRGLMNLTRVFCCPHCRKVLGVASG